MLTDPKWHQAIFSQRLTALSKDKSLAQMLVHGLQRLPSIDPKLGRCLVKSLMTRAECAYLRMIEYDLLKTLSSETDSRVDAWAASIMIICKLWWMDQIA